METKMKYCLLTLLLLLFSVAVFAQTEDVTEPSNSIVFEGNEDISSVKLEEEGAFFIHKGEEGDSLVQLFSWEANEYVFMYRFLLEKQNEYGEWEEFLVKDVEDNHIECSLGPGKYRYSIGLYNFLGIIELETDWLYVEVEKAIQPVIEKRSPSRIYLDEMSDGLFTVRGSGIDEKSSITLKEIDSDMEIPVALAGTKEGKYTTYTLSADMSLFEPGTFRITVRNLGGLSDISDVIKIKKQRAVNFKLSAGYSPVFIFGCKTLTSYFDTSFVPLSAVVKLSIIFLKTSFGNIGVTATASGFYIKNETESYELIAPMFSASANLVYQYYVIPKTLLLDIHGGAGYAGLYHMQFNFEQDVKSKELTVMDLCYTGGISIQYFMGNHFYIEGGVDYLYSKPGGMKLQFVQPSLSVGIKY